MIVGVEDVIEGIVALGLRIAISAQSFDTSETISSNSYQYYIHRQYERRYQIAWAFLKQACMINVYKLRPSKCQRVDFNGHLGAEESMLGTFAGSTLVAQILQIDRVMKGTSVLPVTS
jgi:hypothetical protein